MEVGRKGIAGNGGASHVWKGEIARAKVPAVQSTSLRGAFPFSLPGKKHGG